MSLMTEKNNFRHCFADEFSLDANILFREVVHADIAVCMCDSFNDRKDVVVVRFHFQHVLFE